HYGSTLGSLINVTFGNAAEIIIAIVAINAGLLELVKASITGSILGNIMLIFGLSMIAGGLRQKEQLFNKENAGLQVSLIFLALIGLAIPTILSSTMIEETNVENQSKIQILSDSVAILLLFVYVVGIIFTFFTHKHLFVLPHSNSGDEHNEHDHKHWSKKKCQPFTLEFTLYELVTLFLGAMIMNLIAFDGKSNWFEGIMLTSVYIIIAIGFFFIG
ncbi:MAG TPA: hypothetical protein VE548_08695, partial [Nitrososphaeraceae archaeon]|nr:hypothetical protein [Nitrososphaeraceae archaeon]